MAALRRDAVAVANPRHDLISPALDYGGAPAPALTRPTAGAADEAALLRELLGGKRPLCGVDAATARRLMVSLTLPPGAPCRCCGAGGSLRTCARCRRTVCEACAPKHLRLVLENRASVTGSSLQRVCVACYVEARVDPRRPSSEAAAAAARPAADAARRRSAPDAAAPTWDAPPVPPRDYDEDDDAAPPPVPPRDYAASPRDDEAARSAG